MNIKQIDCSRKCCVQYGVKLILRINKTRKDGISIDRSSMMEVCKPFQNEVNLIAFFVENNLLAQNNILIKMT